MDDIVDLVKGLRETTSNNLRVAMPAKIESYDYKTQKASVKIDMKELTKDNKEVDYPVVNAVPVMFPSSGGASLTMPVQKGDTCLLVFADRNIDAWLLGGSGQKPSGNRSHALSDAIAIVGLNQFTKASKAKNNTDLLITYADSAITLKPVGIVDVTSAKEINIKTENIVINCKNSTINVEETAALTCKNSSVTISETATITCKNLNATCSEVATIGAKNVTATIGEVLTATCNSANITSTGDISITTPNLNVVGNLKITGDSEVTGKAEILGLLTSNGIENSTGTVTTSGKVLDTHTHLYLKPTVGSNPTAATPDQTGGIS